LPHILRLQVIVGSLNDWLMERQFKALSERKKERGVKVIRDGIEKMVDIKVCLLSSLLAACFNPILPYRKLL
jgi:hypothetical protein